MGAFFGPRDWGRLLTAMLTPFDKDGAVDYKEAAKVAAWLVDSQKNDGIVVAGTTGESPTLTDYEKLRLLEVVMETVGDRAAVVFGAGNYNTAESVAMAKEAEHRGAHGVMFVNPYYNRPGQEGLEAHFRACAAATGLPVLLYNIQPRSAINLETPTLLRLSEVKNIVAVKEASGNMNQIADVCSQVPEGFRVYSGDDGLTTAVLSVGGHGLVSVAAHVIGAQLAEIIDLFTTDTAKSIARFQAILPVIRAIFSAPSPVPVKYALAKQGFNCDCVRLPLVGLDGGQKAVVDKALGTLAATL